MGLNTLANRFSTLAEGLVSETIDIRINKPREPRKEPRDEMFSFLCMKGGISFTIRQTKNYRSEETIDTREQKQSTNNCA